MKDYLKPNIKSNEYKCSKCGSLHSNWFTVLNCPCLKSGVKGK